MIEELKLKKSFCTVVFSGSTPPVHQVFSPASTQQTFRFSVLHPFSHFSP